MKKAEPINIDRARDLKAAAYTWKAEGVSVVPVLPRSKSCIVNGWPKYGTGQLEVTDEKINLWFSQGTNNLAIVCGSGGVLALDFDDRKNYDAWLIEVGSYAETYTEVTGRGIHQFYKVSDQAVSRNFSGVEVLGIGHLCNAAPSIHPSGDCYFSPDPLTPIRSTTTENLFSLLSSLFSVTDLVPPAIDRSHNIPDPIVKVGDTAARIKAVYSMHQAASAAGIKNLHRSGRDKNYLVGNCPFHEDKHASFWIDESRNLWGCFSPSCEANRNRPVRYNAKGKLVTAQDVINFYSLLKKIPIDQAISELGREFSL